MYETPIQKLNRTVTELKQELDELKLIVNNMSVVSAAVTMNDGLNSPECSVCEEPAEEMEDTPEDINGVELNVGDCVRFTIAGPDAYNQLTGIVAQDDTGYYIKLNGTSRVQLDNDLINLTMWNER